MEVIQFNETNKMYGFLSNDSEYGFMARGAWWPTATHYYEAHKFFDPKYKELIRNSVHLKIAKIRGHNNAWPIKDNWQSLKDEAMIDTLKAKFIYKDNLGLRKALLETSDAAIIAAIPNNYWGIGEDGKGQNKLGKLLEFARSKLKEMKAQNALQIQY